MSLFDANKTITKDHLNQYQSTFGFHFCNNVAFESHCWAAQKMKFSIEDFFSKCGQIRCKLEIQSHLLKKSLMGNFIQCRLCEERLFQIYSNIEINTSALPLSESRSISKIFRRKCETKYRESICIRGTLYKVFGYNFCHNIFLLVLV